MRTALTHCNSQLKAFTEWLLNLFFPPKCLSCQTLVAKTGSLCAHCWNQMEFVHQPLCVQCGHPFEFSLTEDTLCGECVANPPPYRKARTVCMYNDISRNIVTGLKYSDRTYIAPYIARWMTRNGQSLLEEADYIVPVPLHRLRLFTRRYNQALLLANTIGKQTGIPLMHNLLKRKRHTPPQAGLTRNQRLKNVTGAFTIRSKYHKRICQKHIVLIDDVMTTGATIHACTRALLKAGAVRVDVITFSRTRNDH